ncbi:citrate/2-methylcitrate synthase [Elusimicrobiota bacterium]
MKRIPPKRGMLYYIIKKIRPDIAGKIFLSGEIETIVVGLGRQGVKHAGLMKDFGTTVRAAVAPGKGGSRLHEVIPVYNDVKECLKEHPGIAAASIWHHYSSARDAALELIEAGIPIVILITEGIPQRDVRDILNAAKKKGTFLIGGNTPGVIFPPEGIKIGMLPDVFYPEVTAKDSYGPRGITIISRSGAILYHMSDALSSEGIAQNAVIGAGGDSAGGMTFRDLVPLVSAYKNTDLVVVAGEIGGCQEELLAEDIKKHPEKYPKPIVALISGANAPEGKTMGHAGAIVAHGTDRGTFRSKKRALECAGIPVVNSQQDLIKAVKTKLGGRTYYKTNLYYEDMAKKWEALPGEALWGTYITKVEPDSLVIAGYSLPELIEKASLIETAHILAAGELPSKKTLKELNETAVIAAALPPPGVSWRRGEDISKYLARCLLTDTHTASYAGKEGTAPASVAVFTLGRIAACISKAFNKKGLPIKKLKSIRSFDDILFYAFTGRGKADPDRARMLGAIVTACVDHGVTPPSAQATIIAATTRPAFEVAVAQGVGAITDVHGGAGAKAAEFFLSCIELVKKKGLSRKEAVHTLITEYMGAGRLIEGLGHRIHTRDPRCRSLWKLAGKYSAAGECVEISRIVTDEFRKVRGMDIPINVDGVAGAITADMGLPRDAAKALFVCGRIMGLCAHYFEEITLYPPMRRIDFSKAVYKGSGARKYPRSRR